MADEAQPALRGKTPLQYARTPAMDHVAQRGIIGLLHSIPPGHPVSSEVAILSLLGYDPAHIAASRGVWEAIGTGITLDTHDLAMRCNLVSLDAEGRLTSHSAGEISKEEGETLIAFLQERLGDDTLHLYPGLAYRHSLVLKGGKRDLLDTPPQNVRGNPAIHYPIQALTPEAQITADRLNTLTATAQRLLSAHPINLYRQSARRLPANGLWVWAPGYRPSLDPLPSRYGFRRGAVIAGVPLIKGIGACADLQIINVPGATGYWDTDYAGKASAAQQALVTNDFILLHVEAPDECSHEGDLIRKIESIENIDRFIVSPLIQTLEQQTEPYRLAILPDHFSLCRTRTHAEGPVPFALCGTDIQPDAVNHFDEQAAHYGSCEIGNVQTFIQRFFLR